MDKEKAEREKDFSSILPENRFYQPKTESKTYEALYYKQKAQIEKQKPTSFTIPKTSNLAKLAPSLLNFAGISSLF